MCRSQEVLEKLSNCIEKFWLTDEEDKKHHFYFFRKGKSAEAFYKELMSIVVTVLLRRECHYTLHAINKILIRTTGLIQVINNKPLREKLGCVLRNINKRVLTLSSDHSVTATTVNDVLKMIADDHYVPEHNIELRL